MVPLQVQVIRSPDKVHAAPGAEETARRVATIRDQKRPLARRAHELPAVDRLRLFLGRFPQREAFAANARIFGRGALVSKNQVADGAFELASAAAPR
jgi:hypothetical protein